ncbi:MAG TPA: VacB/RNase II family 3'-5' exoribonuclease [Spirochaetota bacterium]
MALSSKKIIEYIQSFQGEQFSVDELIHLIFSRSKKKAMAKKSPKKTNRDIGTIHETVTALKSIGYLVPQKRSVIAAKYFPKSGTITVSKGHAEITAGKIQILIKPEDMESAHNGDLVEFSIIEIRRKIIFGRVRRVLQKSRDRYLAIVDSKTKGMILFRLIDLPGENFAVMERFENEPEIGDYTTIRILNKMIAGRPSCEIIERFAAGSDAYDIDRIILRHSLPGVHRAYPEYSDPESSVPSNEMKNRRDFRNLLTVTIDGEHAKDFDDAVSFEKTDTVYTLYVHIADVSAYVAKDSPLDREAYRRGTSYYLGNRVIPMLPEILSNNYCSLRPHEDRLTLSAIMKYNHAGDLIHSEFTRGIIHSFKRLTYESASGLIDNPDGTPLAQMLSELYEFTLLLKKKRRSRGRVDLQINDFELRYEKDRFEDIIRAVRFKSHSLVEESMLSANEAVSQALRTAQVPSLYRVHEPMSSDQLASLKKFLRTLGVKFREGTNLGKSLQEIVDSVEGKAFAHVVNFVILRSMMQASYEDRPLGHFGLGFRDYTHFTSPIRRYPDLIVHRCLKSLIDKTPPPYTNEELAATGLESSRLERIAQKAERDLFKIKSCRLMEGHEGERFDAIISGVSKYGIYVTLTDTPIEGMIPLRFVTDDYYVVIEDEFRAVGRRYGKSYTLGDHVQVRLMRVDIATLQIDFEFIHGKGTFNETGISKEGPTDRKRHHHSARSRTVRRRKNS